MAQQLDGQDLAIVLVTFDENDAAKLRLADGGQRCLGTVLGEAPAGLEQFDLGQFDLGPAAAMSLIYFLIVLLLSWIFYTVMTKDEVQ